jgi:hypothetical protein
MSRDHVARRNPSPKLKPSISAAIAGSMLPSDGDRVPSIGAQRGKMPHNISTLSPETSRDTSLALTVRCQLPRIDRKPCRAARCECATAAAQTAGTLMEIAIASTRGLSRKENVVGPFRPSSDSRSRADSSETPAHTESESSCLPFNAIILTIRAPMTRLCCRPRRLKSQFMWGRERDGGWLRLPSIQLVVSDFQLVV